MDGWPERQLDDFVQDIAKYSGLNKYIHFNTYLLPLTIWPYPYVFIAALITTGLWKAESTFSVTAEYKTSKTEFFHLAAKRMKE